MTFVIYDKTKVDNVWFVKGFDFEVAKFKTDIPIENVALLAQLSDSELTVLNNCPQAAIKSYR